MKTNNRVHRSMTSVAAACVALALLAGCSSSGGGSGVNPSSNGNNTTPVMPTPASTPDTTPTAKSVESAGNTVMATGNAVSGIGKQIQDAPIPLLPADARNGAGGVVVNAGETVGALGAGVRDGLGQMGAVDNPVGVTVASTGNVVQKAGDTVTSAGQLVGGLGTEQLSPLAPLTTPVSGVVQKVGGAVSAAGGKLGDALSGGPVAQLTGSTSTAIVPLTTQLTDGTQNAGAMTGAGAPMDGLLTKVGNTVATGGSMLTNTNAPVISPVGGVVTEAGKTVAAAGVLVQGGSGGSSGGNPLGGVLNNLSLAAGGSTVASKSDGQSSPLGPLTTLLAPVTGLASGVKSAAGGSGGDAKALPLPLPVGGLLR
ncbi:collagen-like triple helix repeat-containing protein [Cupriavidus sp. IDO]|uniref:collagen-like triple helix repeat-containing protein n=1 Tax=Cupriavidus sp. IDO TaxID=1539142 RepID=UPI00057949F7|nr:collagen-like triple helix repeat-containing protein [Cupriavidus sp. IDO]KWR88566.1 hemagglutinin [Cupriavidus sp. IDO]